MVSRTAYSVSALGPGTYVPYRGEAGEVPIESDDLAMVFDGYRREHGVGNQITRRVCLLAEFMQQCKVAWAGAGDEVVGLGAGGVDKQKCVGAW